MLHRAQVQGGGHLWVINLRDFATDRHQVTDDRPFGGAAGEWSMKIESRVWRPSPDGERARPPRPRVILLGPGGAAFNQAKGPGVGG